MAKKRVLTGKELIIEFLKYGILIFAVISIIDLFSPNLFVGDKGAVYITSAGALYIIIRFSLILVLLWISLKRIDKLNRYFNKYTVLLGVLITYNLINTVIFYFVTKQIEWGLGLFPILAVLILAKFTKLQNHRSDFSLLLKETN